MSAQHTQGRLAALKVSDGFSLFDEQWNRIADFPNFDPSNPRRLAACWNAFEGVSTDEIAAMGGMTLFKGKPTGELAAARADLAVAKAQSLTTANLMIHWRDTACKNGMGLFAARALMIELLGIHDAGEVAADCDGGVTASFGETVERIRAFLKGQP